MPWQDPMLARIYKNSKYGMQKDGTRTMNLGIYAAETFYGFRRTERKNQVIVFSGPPCRTLDDMNESEITEIERIYKCKVLRKN